MRTEQEVRDALRLLREFDVEGDLLVEPEEMMAAREAQKAAREALEWVLDPAGAWPSHLHTSAWHCGE